MAEVADLWVKLSLLSSGFTEGLAKSGAEAEGFSGKVSKVGSALASVVKVGAVAGIGIAAVSVKMAGDWQASMSKLVTSAGETGGVVQGKLTGPISQVSDGLLKMAVSTGTSTKSLADGMYFVESAGFHGAAGLKVMQAAAEGARAEGANLSTVTDALTTALHDMGQGANYSVPMMNMMVKAVGDGKMTMEAFAGSLHSVLPQAHQAGIEFPDVAAAIATMTVAGTSADQATQMLGHTISSLQNSTVPAVKYMAQMGISAQDLKDHLGDRGLLGTVTMLDQAILSHMDKDGHVLQSAFNESKTAGDDLNRMLATMPNKLRDWSVSVEHGTMTAKDYTGAIKGLPANLYAQGQQFLTTYKNANSFNDTLKKGGPAVDSFAGALRKALGDQVDTNTALQLGGANLAYYAQAANDVAKAGQNAGDHIETWSTIQQGFNFRIDQAKEAVQTTAIKLGTALLPKLMSLFDLVTTRGAPVLHQLETDVRNALDSPGIHQAEAIIAEFWHNFVTFVGEAKTSAENLWRAVQPIAAGFAGAFFGALQLVGGTLKNVVGPALVAVTGFLRDNAGTVHLLAEVALAGLIAKLLYTKTLLAFDMFTSFVNGIGTAIIGVSNFAKSVASGQVFDTIRLKAMYAADSVRGLGVAEGEAAAAGNAAAGINGLGGLASRVGGFMLGGALIGGAVAGVVSLGNWISNLGHKAGDATDLLNKMTNQLLDIAGGTQAANTQLGQFAVLAMKNTKMGDLIVKPIDDALTQLVQSGHIDQAKQALLGLDGAVTGSGKSADTFNKMLTKYNDSLGSYAVQQREAALSTQNSAGATSADTGALGDNSAALAGNSSALSDTSNTLGGTANATDNLANATSNLMQQQQDMSKGLNADRALDDYNRAVNNLTKSLHDNGTAINGSSEAAMNNRDALRQAVQSIIDNYNAQVQLGGDTDAANKKLNDQINQLENVKGASKTTKDAIKTYIDSLNIIPPNITTTITANTAAATAQVRDLQNKLNNLAFADNSGSTSPKTMNPPPVKHRQYALGGWVDGPKGAPQLAVVHGGEYILSNDMLTGSAPAAVSGGGIGGAAVNNYITNNIQGSVLAERDLRDLMESQMLQLGGRRPATYAPYQR